MANADSLPVMNPRLMRTFLAVLRHGSFTRAAEEVHLAQSTVSDQIQALEAELSTPLFIRSRGNLTVTPAAQALRPYAEELLKLADDARAAVASTVDQARQILTVGSLETIAIWRLAGWLPRLKVLYPNLQVNLRIAGSGELQRLLERGQIDVAIGFYDERPGEGYMARILAREPLSLLRRADAPEDIRWNDLSALAAEDFVVTEVGCTYHRMFDDVFRQHGVGPPEPIAEVSSVGAIINFVAAGSCLGVAPRLAAEMATHRGDVRQVDWPGIEPTVPLTMIWRRRRSQSLGLRQFLDAATPYFAGAKPNGDHPPREERCRL